MTRMTNMVRRLLRHILVQLSWNCYGLLTRDALDRRTIGHFSPGRASFAGARKLSLDARARAATTKAAH